MLFRTIVKTACMLSLVAVAGCDPDLVDVDAEAAEVEAEPRPTPELAAEEGEGDAERVSFDAGLDLREGAEGTAYSCWVGSREYHLKPSGTCGGCTISGSYPGQTFIEYERVCASNGYWGAWVQTKTRCEHC